MATKNKLYEVEVKGIAVQTRGANIEEVFKKLESQYETTRESFGYWRIVPTKKQLARTKSLMQGL